MNINEKCQKYGIKRLETLKNIKSKEDFLKLWPKQKNSFDFKWGDCWKGVFEYGVDDYAAEIGFYIDYLGFELNASWDNHAMLMTPQGEFMFTVYEDKKSKGKVEKYLNIQFMIENIMAVSKRLKKNKITVIQNLKNEWGKESKMKTFKVVTPNNICITLWGFSE
jgi:Glyoxalase/Bleomycin resistance protein/Dioxygenase superfamily